MGSHDIYYEDLNGISINIVAIVAESLLGDVIKPPEIRWLQVVIN